MLASNRRLSIASSRLKETGNYVLPLAGQPMSQPEKSALVKAGDRVSAWTANIFAHPYMQIGVILLCVTWFALKLDTNLLTPALSILAITLTQMVLSSQNERECDDRRRDLAMHAKLDELQIR